MRVVDLSRGDAAILKKVFEVPFAGTLYLALRRTLCRSGSGLFSYGRAIFLGQLFEAFLLFFLLLFQLSGTFLIRVVCLGHA